MPLIKQPRKNFTTPPLVIYESGPSNPIPVVKRAKLFYNNQIQWRLEMILEFWFICTVAVGTALGIVFILKLFIG